jgi:hypothetical protein
MERFAIDFHTEEIGLPERGAFMTSLQSYRTLRSARSPGTR